MLYYMDAQNMKLHIYVLTQTYIHTYLMCFKLKQLRILSVNGERVAYLSQLLVGMKFLQYPKKNIFLRLSRRTSDFYFFVN